MIKNGFFILLCVFHASFLVSCNKSELPPETTTTIVIENNLGKAPTSLTYPVIYSTYFQGMTVTPNVATVNGEQASMSFSIEPALPEGLSINSSTGLISGIPLNLMEQSFYTVRAKNNYGIVSTTVSLKVVIPPPLDLVYPQIDSVNQILYNYREIGSIWSPGYTGTVQNFTIEPELPAGMHFDMVTGNISGMPQITDSTRLGKTYFYSIKAFNQSGSTTYNLKLKYIDIGPTNLSYLNTDAIYNVGNPIATNKPSYSGGTIALFVLDPVRLPAGLFFNSLSGEIQGTPLEEVASQITYTITAYNTGGFTSTNITMRILSNMPLSLTYSNVDATYVKGLDILVNNPIHTGGKPTHYSVTPSLPTGLILDQNNGSITGKPTVLQLTPVNYTIVGSNTGGQQSKIISIKVIDQAPLQIHYSNNNVKIRRNELFSVEPIGNAGGAVITYAIDPALPAGLNFDVQTGLISGAPTVLSAKINYTITAYNSGGSYSFPMAIEIIQTPNYNFNLVLLSKEFAGFSSTNYLFELQNISKEFDNSSGINLIMPITVSSTATGISTLINSNNCIEKTSLEYLGKCLIKINYVDDGSNPLNIFVSVKASNIATKFLDIRDYTDLSPRNVKITGDRPIIHKAVINQIDLPVITTNIASCSAGQSNCSFLPIVTSVTSNDSLLSISDKASNVLQNIPPSTNSFTVNNDPDNDGTPGNNLQRNLSFTSSIVVSADVLNYTPTCIVNPPYEAAASCHLGEFFLGSANIFYSGLFNLTLGTTEGLDTEITMSNSIPINVYRIKRLASIDDNENVPGIVAHKNKIYFPGLVSSSNAYRKLLRYNPTSGNLTQVSNITNNSDYPYPFASYNDFLFLKMRNLSGNIEYFTYDEVQNKIMPLYTNTPVINVAGNSFEDMFYFIANNKIYLPGSMNAINYLFSYDSENVRLKTEIIPMYTSTNATNNIINRKSFVQYNSNLYFTSKLMSGATSRGTKLISYNDSNKIQKIVSDKNSVTADDYLNEPHVYDGKLYYMSQATETSGDVQGELISYSEDDYRMKKVFLSERPGKSVILGIYYNKLFFKMPGLKNGSSSIIVDKIYYYDAANGEIVSVFETGETNEKIIKINKFANFSNKNELIFIVEKGSSRELYALSLDSGNYKINRNIDSGTIGISSSPLLFSYNGSFFITCDTGDESLCVIDPEKNVLSYIASGFKIKIDENVPSSQSIKGLVFMNNRLYFTTGNAVNSTNKAGIYEMCVLLSTGCQ